MRPAAVSEPQDRSDAQLELLHQFAVEDDKTAAELDGAAGEPGDRWLDHDWQPVRFGTNRETGADELLEAGAETEGKAGERILRRGEVRHAQAGGQERSEALD